MACTLGIWTLGLEVKHEAKGRLSIAAKSYCILGIMHIDDDLKRKTG